MSRKSSLAEAGRWQDRPGGTREVQVTVQQGGLIRCKYSLNSISVLKRTILKVGSPCGVA
uniref:Uncharacterized protein n=1 Tax=Aegilops tauschii subsp. strangulata TaxID=200361 RepID=A0A453DVJ8_AEGTS